MSGEKGQFDKGRKTGVGVGFVNVGDGLFQPADARYAASQAGYEKSVYLSVGEADVLRRSNAAGRA